MIFRCRGCLFREKIIDRLTALCEKLLEELKR